MADGSLVNEIRPLTNETGASLTGDYAKYLKFPVISQQKQSSTSRLSQAGGLHKPQRFWIQHEPWKRGVGWQGKVK